MLTPAHLIAPEQQPFVKLHVIFVQFVLKGCCPIVEGVCRLRADETEINERSHDDVFWANVRVLTQRPLLVPVTIMPNELVFRKHPVLTSLHAERTIVDEEDQVCPFPVSALQ